MRVFNQVYMGVFTIVIHTFILLLSSHLSLAFLASPTVLVFMHSTSAQIILHAQSRQPSICAISKVSVSSRFCVLLQSVGVSARLVPSNLDLGLGIRFLSCEGLGGRSVIGSLKMAPIVTEIVNNTQRVLNVKVGNQQYFVDFAKIRKGSKHTMQVDYNDTYQEFLMGPDRTGKNVIVTSDECCDYRCITISEVDGQFTVDRVPRMYYRSVDEEVMEPDSASAKRHCHCSSWKTLWKLRI